MAKKDKETALTVAGSTALMERPAWMRDKDSGRGSEEVGLNDLTIPRLVIIQDLSPQRKKNQPEYIEGAEEGMMFNTVTNQLFREYVLFVPCYYRMEWVLWKHRDVGGGFLGAYLTQEEAVAAYKQQPQAGQMTSDNDPVIEIHDTGQHFGLLLDPDAPAEARGQEIVISMSRSQLKPSRQFNSQIKLAGGDRWERYYRLEPVVVDGQKGSYYNWKISQLGFVSEAVFNQAEALYEAVKSGKRDVERTSQESTATSAQDDDKM